MSRHDTLLEQVGRLLERTYAMDSGVLDPARFVIGDRAYRERYGTGGAAHPAVGTAGGEGARVLVREIGAEVRVSVYLPDALIARLERFPPQRGLDERNVDAFAALVEEVDHLLLLGERWRQRRPVSLFELELHANVSKHLVLTRFLAGRRPRLSEAARGWLRHHLFLKGRYCDADPEIRERYRAAARWALRFLDALARLDARQRLEALRRFHRAGVGETLAWIERLAA